MSDPLPRLDDRTVALLEEPDGRLIIYVKSIPVGHVVYSDDHRKLGLTPQGRFGNDARTLLLALGGNELAQEFLRHWDQLDMRSEPARPGTAVVAVYEDGCVWSPPEELDGTVVEPGWAARCYIGPQGSSARTGTVRRGRGR